MRELKSLSVGAPVTAPSAASGPVQQDVSETKALAKALSHQAMCGGIMLAGHALSGAFPAVGAVMAHPATNMGLTALAAYCWHKGDKEYMRARGHLSQTWKKVAARGTIAVAGAGMMLMHAPGVGLHDHSNHGDHGKHHGHGTHYQPAESEICGGQPKQKPQTPQVSPKSHHHH